MTLVGAEDSLYEDFRKSVRQFVEREYLAREEDFTRERGFDRALWLKAGELGILGLHIPASFGGVGVTDYRFPAVAIEELARGGVALASCLSVHFDVVIPYVVKFGTQEQQQRWLPSMATGAVVAGIAMTEPGAGSDLAAISTTATPTPTGWLLRGAKTFITNGAIADVFIVAARTSPARRGVSLFLVSADRVGFTRGRKLNKVGIPQADTSELAFDDVQLGPGELLGELDGGFDLMRRQLVQERLGSAVANVAHARSVLEYTLTYAHHRRAFGKAIGTLQGNRFTLARCFADLQLASAFVQDCVTRHSAGSLGEVDAAVAKWRSSEIQNYVIDCCLQLHGGYGYMTEYPVARAWSDARVTRIWAGTNEIMADIVGKSLVR